MESLKNEIISFIKENRVSTTEVADCMGKTGVLPDIYPINSGSFAVGEVCWVYTYAESNWDLHRQIENIDKDKIVFVDAIDCKDRAIAGELVCKYLVLYKQSRAIVVEGKMRDAHSLIKEKYPLWCKGVTPIGCFNNKPQTDVDLNYISERKEYFDGSIVVCDDSGVLQ